MIRVLYFARVREQMGQAEESIEWQPGLRTLDAIREHLIVLHPDKDAVLQARDLLVARNQTMTSWQEPVADGDEVAIFPPVTGG